MPHTLSVELPFSKPEITANSRFRHWAAEALIKRTLRETMFNIACYHKLPIGLESITVRLVYEPRDRRRRDPGNLMPMQKHLLDGLVDYGMVPDDNQDYVTELVPKVREPSGKKGRMWMEITIP